MEDEAVIKQQMENSRTALSDKLESLEKQVTHTVQEAASAVTDTVASIKDTVSSVHDTVSTVKDTVEGTVTAVKDGVQDSIAAVKDWMDLGAHVERSPWLMTGGAVVAGFVLGQLFGKARPAASSTTEQAYPENGRNGNGNGNGHRSMTGAGRSKRQPAQAVRSFLSDFGPEFEKLKGLALGALLGTAREVIVNAVPEELGTKLSEIVDNVTTKLGGQPIASFGNAQGGYRTTEGDDHDQRHAAEMGGSVGSTHRQGEKTLGQFDRR